MTNNKIERVVIVGGGTAGWLTAALLSKILGKALDITVVESDKIGTVGVGEATIPPIVDLNRALGIEESRFLHATKGTIKLGIEFEGWGAQGQSYMHAFGKVGKDLPFCEFHHLWHKSHLLGNEKTLGHYSLNRRCALENKFAKLDNVPRTNLAGLAYAYHFDAGLYAKLLREVSEARGANRVEGIIEQVEVNDDSGFVEHVTLQGGQQISGDLFIDCSGLAALLIEKTLKVGFEDWSQWLPCDSAVAVPSEPLSTLKPYTHSIARSAGWQWQIPLQHRVGNGLVYSSKHLSDDEAIAQLLDGLDSEPLDTPRVIKFKTGRRSKQWHKNVVSIGLSSGFLEPLESTSIHLIQSAATRLVKLFPHQGVKQVEVDEFNRQSASEIEAIRDFIILHYKATSRDDSEFWRQCATMDIPQALADKIELFKQTGKVSGRTDDLFSNVAWQQVLLGQGIMPQDHHPLASTLSDEQVMGLMDNLDVLLGQCVEQLPTHRQFIELQSKS